MLAIRPQSPVADVEAETALSRLHGRMSNRGRPFSAADPGGTTMPRMNGEPG